ncbi:MAG TPA: DUF177 domain-containing protein [bacterium]|nr:DUF177 domain-containing protein [bacterium]
MLININAIPEEGKILALNRETGWFLGLLRQKLSDLSPQFDSAEGEIEIHKTLQNISMAGDVRLRLAPTCARCGQAFETDLEIPIQRHMVPYFAGPREELLSEEEEIELSADDLDFSFYHGEEINLGEILGEEITLALPMRFLCREDCRGLCPRCGKNLNQGDCGCQNLDDFSPFSALKDLKLKS